MAWTIGNLEVGLPPKWGIRFEPAHKTAPIAALRDSSFYDYLALDDALRDGRARERKTAEVELSRRLRDANERLKS